MDRVWLKSTLKTISYKFLHIWQEYLKLQINQRLYVNAIVILSIFLMLSLVTGIYGARSMFFIFVAFWVAAIIYDLVFLYKKTYKTIIGKMFIIILFSLCTNFAMALSSQVVNDITGVDPTKFPRTIAFLTILTIPIFISAGFGILYFVMLILSPILLMFHTVMEDRVKEVLIPGYSSSQLIPYQKVTRVLQFLSISVFCGVIFGLSQRFAQTYERFLSDTASSFLFKMEMYSKAPYSIKPGCKVAFLGDEKLLVAEKVQNHTDYKVVDFKKATESKQ